MKQEYRFFGKHLLVEAYGIEKKYLNDIDFFLEFLGKGIEKANVTNCGIMVKKFIPTGITIIILLAESHISLHTYPEEESFFLDVFTCGEKNPKIIFEELQKQLLNSLNNKKEGVIFNVNILERGKRN